MLERLKRITQNVLINEPMSSHTTFKIGGACDYLVLPATVEELKQVVALSRAAGIRLTILGNGSNVLVSDSGLDGIVIKTTRMRAIRVFGNRITADAGASLCMLCDIAQKNALGGLAELSGIPGTVGGGVYMNAGAYGGEIKDTLVESSYLSESGEVKTMPLSEHRFSYRHSGFSEHPDRVILESVFELLPADKEELKEKTIELLKKRNEKQPLNFPNAGSTFKRPEGHFAGKLIEDCRLRGYRVGDAQVSEKHCGFVINRGNATADDIKRLIYHVKETVFREFGVELEPEIKYYERGTRGCDLLL